MFDVGDAAFLRDPYPFFAELREHGDVHEHPQLGAVTASHAAGSAALRSRKLGRLWTDAQPAGDFPMFNLLHRHSMLESEPPVHTRLRRLVSAAFGRGHVDKLREPIRATVADLVDGLDGDLVEQVAAPLPVAVIAELLGVPETDRPLLPAWSHAIVKMYEPGVGEQQRVAAETASAEFVAYLRELAAHRREHPGEDLISGLMATPGEQLHEDEMVATAVLLLMAGHEASINLLANGVLALLRHPEQWRRLVADPGLAPSAVDELIRFDSPLQLFERTAVSDVDIGGHRVHEGEKIAVLLGAAAHDPEVFERPGRLDITRSPNPHLGFGAGLHYCLGAPLARLEAQTALEELVRRRPELHLTGEPERRPEFVIRGLRTLPVG